MSAVFALAAVSSPLSVRAVPQFVASFSSANQVAGLAGPLQVAATEGYFFVLADGAIDVRSRDYPHGSVARYGSSGSDEGFFFRSPKGMALNAAGDRLAVADTGNNRIQLFSVDGRDLAFLKAFGCAAPTNEPLADGTFDAPGAVAFTASGELLVADTRNHRVQHFSAGGTHLATYPVVSGGATISAVCADEEDVGYWAVIKENGNNRLAHFAFDATTHDAERGASLGTYSDVKTLGGGYLVVSDSGYSKVLVLDARADLAGEPVCEFGQRNGPGGAAAALARPLGVFVRPGENRVFVADTGKDRVAWYDLAGYVPPEPPPGVLPPGQIYPGGASPAPCEAGLVLSPTNKFDCSEENVCPGQSLVVDVAVSGDYVYSLVRHAKTAGGAITPDHIAVYRRTASPERVARYFGFEGATGAPVRLSSPESLSLNEAGDRLAVADTYHDRVLLFDVDGTNVTFRQAITNVTLFAASAGNPSASPAAAAVYSKTISPALSKPRGVSFAAGDDLLVADSGNSRVLRVRAGPYESADSYGIGEDGKSTLEDVCHDVVAGREGFWAVDSRKSAPPSVAFYPFGSPVPAYVSPALFDHPVGVSVWNDGAAKRLAVLDKTYSAVLVFRISPGKPEMGLCALAGSAFTTNSCASPAESGTRLWGNEKLWDRVERDGRTVFVPSDLMQDATRPKLQNPGGLDVYSENGTNVIYVADTGNRRFVWYGLATAGGESGGDTPDPRRPVRWPFSSIEILPADGGTPAARKVALGWQVTAPPPQGEDAVFRIDHAADLNGPWTEGLRDVAVPASSGAGSVEIGFSELDPARNFFKLWWMNCPVLQP